MLIEGLMLMAMGGTPGPRYRYRLMYNLGAEKVYEGTVVKVETYPAPWGNGMPGVFVSLKLKDGTVEKVYLGPEWYVSSRITVKVGDTLKVTGAVSTYEGKNYVLAREVERNRVRVTLRDKNGFPVWAGSGAGAGRGAGKGRGAGRGGKR